MCRSTSDLWLAAGGTSIAGILAALRIHWDMLRDRRAWRDAVRRGEGKRDAEDDSGDTS